MRDPLEGMDDDARFELAKGLLEVTARALDAQEGVPVELRPTKRNLLRAIDMAEAEALRVQARKN